MNGSDRQSLCGQDLYLFNSPVYTQKIAQGLPDTQETLNTSMT